MRPPLCAEAERNRLCDLLDRVGPDAPTLCPGWTTGDLAAHLVVREHSPLAAARLRVPGLAGVPARAIARVRRQPFPAVVERIRRGGVLPRDGRLGEALHLFEFVVHRQDVLRASPQPPVPEGDDDVAARDAAVFEQLRRGGAGRVRRIPAGVGLLLRSPRHGCIEVRRGPMVLLVSGDPVEIALWVFGRARESRVAVEHNGGPSLRQLVEASLSG